MFNGYHYLLKNYVTQRNIQLKSVHANLINFQRVIPKRWKQRKLEEICTIFLTFTDVYPTALSKTKIIITFIMYISEGFLCPLAQKTNVQKTDVISFIEYSTRCSHIVKWEILRHLLHILS